jgi:hypothetical protein
MIKVTMIGRLDEEVRDSHKFRLPNRHKMIYINKFVIHLSCIQSIKQLIDIYMSMCYMSCMYIYVYLNRGFTDHQPSMSVYEL